jgi:hypothetical protein
VKGHVSLLSEDLCEIGEDLASVPAELSLEDFHILVGEKLLVVFVYDESLYEQVHVSSFHLILFDEVLLERSVSWLASSLNDLSSRCRYN